jgi:hypothetical protein
MPLQALLILAHELQNTVFNLEEVKKTVLDFISNTSNFDLYTIEQTIRSLNNLTKLGWCLDQHPGIDRYISK